VTMDIQHGNGSENIYEVRRQFVNSFEKDMFMYRLIGAMSLYLDRETMQSCIESASADLLRQQKEEKAS